MKKILTIAILLITQISFGQIKTWKAQGDGTPAGIGESKVAQMISDSLSTINLSGYSEIQVDSITAQIRSEILLKLNKSDSTIANRVTANTAAIGSKFTLPSLTSGSFLFSDGTTIAQDNSNLFWDNSAKKVVYGSSFKVNTQLVTTANKNTAYYLFEDGTGKPLLNKQYSYWNGSSYVYTNSLGLGLNALRNNSGKYSVGIGDSALQNNSGDQSTGVGAFSLYGNSGIAASGFGYGALQNNSGAYGTGFGNMALNYNTGAQVSSFGFSAGQGNTGVFLSSFGYIAGRFNTGGYSSAFGSYSLAANSGAYASGFGYNSLQNNTGTFTSGLGANSLQNSTGNGVTGMGYNSLQNNTGPYSTGLGYTALQNNTGVFSNGFGHQSGYNNTGDSVSAFGLFALKNNNSRNRIFIGSTLFENAITIGGSVKVFASANISGINITITSHGFASTTKKVNLLYNVISGTTVTGLTNGQMYQFTVVDGNTLSCPLISGSGSGSFTLTKDVDKSNSIAIGNNIDNTKANQTLIGSYGNLEIKFNGALAFDSIQSKRLIIIGDSYSVAGNWPLYLSDSIPTLSRYNKVNFAVSGQKTYEMVANYATTAHLAKPNTGDDFWLFCYAGINDLAGAALSADSVYTNLKYLWSNARSDGFKVVAFTVIKSLYLTPSKDSQRVKLNNYILGNSSLYDYVIDQSSVFNPSVDYTVFADSTHLNATGWKMFAGTIARTINDIPYTLTTTQPISAAYPLSHTPTSFNVSSRSAASGFATLSSGTVTVTTPFVSANSKISATVTTVSGTQGFISVPTSSIISGTSFVINSSSASDASTITWVIN
ncbi:MAG: SGNH/GDSL hydrolase family protein [Ferruginibacter sp.]